MTKRGKYVSTRNKLALLALFFMCFLGAKAQTDYSGVYYIASDNSANSHPGVVYNASTPEKNYYLVPAANPQQSSCIDAYYSPNHNEQNGDPEQPFLATYKTNKDLNSIWLIVESGESDYYFVIHALSGKYVIHERPFHSISKAMVAHASASASAW